MKRLELERPLESQALREIERSLHGKLRAHRLSDAFIARCCEDALQKGLVEYLRAIENGASIDNRDAFVVDVAFKRAVDELRRESRSATATSIEEIIEAGEVAVPATEEIAVGLVLAEELHRAIGALSPEQRQILRLYYFDEVSAQRAAELMHLSERTYRRRLGQSIAALGSKLGVQPPSQGSIPAFHIGLAAWVSLRGADIVPRPGGLLEGFLAAVERARRGASSSLGRAGDLTARTTASGDTEKLTAIASGPAGKVAGGCAGAAIVCLLAGVVGPGVELGSPSSHQPTRARPHSKPHAHLSAPTPPTPSAGLAVRSDETARSHGADAISTPTAAKQHASPARSSSPRRGAGAKARRKAAAARAESQRVEEQVSAVARATEDAETETETAPAISSAAPTESSPPVVVEPKPEPTHPSEEREAEKQFGGPFHR